MKSKMSINVMPLFLALLVILFSHVSCRKYDLRAVEQRNRQDITNSDAQEVFKKSEVALQNRFRMEYGQINPLWEKSELKKLSPENMALYTPLAFNKTTGSYLQLVCLKDKGKFRSLITEVQPSEEYYEKLGFQDFYAHVTGRLLFYSVTGKFIRGFKMQWGKSQGAYYPETELDNVAVLTRTAALGVRSAVNNDDPCEDEWGNFGCQELESVVVVATPSSGGAQVFISIPINLYYSYPTGGTYGGYAWAPIAEPTTYDLIDLGLSPGKPCPATFRFKNLTTNMRRSLVWGLYFAVHHYPSNTIAADVTFGLQIDIPSDIIASPTWAYNNLSNKFGSRLTNTDLVLYTDNNGIQHLRISQAAQTLIATEAVHETNLFIKLNGIIPDIAVSTSMFKQQYKEELNTKLFGYLGGCQVQILNSNTDGTTPYKIEGLFGC